MSVTTVIHMLQLLKVYHRCLLKVEMGVEEVLSPPVLKKDTV